jgi:hypothetical protein
VTTFPRIISHKTFISRFSLSDFDIVVGPFVLILDKIVFLLPFMVLNIYYLCNIFCFIVFLISEMSFNFYITLVNIVPPALSIP